MPAKPVIPAAEGTKRTSGYLPADVTRGEGSEMGTRRSLPFQMETRSSSDTFLLSSTGKRQETQQLPHGLSWAPGARVWLLGGREASPATRVEEAAC